MEPLESVTREVFLRFSLAERILFYVLSVLTIGVFVYGFYVQARRWMQGRDALFAWDRIPERLWRVFRQVLGQAKLLRESYRGFSHLLAFWGFVVLFIGTVILTIDEDTPLHFFYGDFYLAYSWTLDLFGLFLLGGLVLFGVRRYGLHPKGLSYAWDDHFLFWMLLLLGITGFSTETLRIAGGGVAFPAYPEFERVSFVGFGVAKMLRGADPILLHGLHKASWWVHGLLSLGFIAVLPYTKAFHFFSSLLNVFLAPFETKQYGVPSNIDLENAESIGYSSFRDFAKQELLSLDACTRCGRCQEVCPAYATQKPLSPKGVILDLKGAMLEADGEDKPLAGGVITDDVLWSCTTCKACVEACPVEINQMGLILELRRSLLFEMQTPYTLGQSLKRTTNSANPWGLPNEDRLAWAKGLHVPLAAETEGGFEWLYWVGCSASFDPRNQKIARSMVKLLEASGVNYAVLGPEEKCTVEWARRAGEEGLFQLNTLENIETFKRYNVSKILTHCPHCLNTFKNDYPQFGFRAQVVHHSTLLRDMVKQGRLKLEKKIPESLVFHDSCYLGRYNGEYDAPRELLHAVSKSPIREMERRREKSFCCGGGGGLSWMELDIGKKINHERIEEAAATGGKTLAAACPFCVSMFDDAIKVKNLEEEIKVKDLSEILVECL